MRHLLPGNSVLLQAEFEELLTREVEYIGIDKAYVALLSPDNQQVYQFIHQIGQSELTTYLDNVSHDAYLNEYIKQSLFDEVVYLQKLVPEQSIRDSIFHDLIKPSIGLDHSVGVISKLIGGYHAVLSTHSDKAIGHHSHQLHQILWRFILSWLTHTHVQERLFESMDDLSVSKLTTVTPFTICEGIVFNLLISGMTGSEIAKFRGVSKETVKSQIKQILHKTNSKNQVQLVTKYYQGKLSISGNC